MVVTIEETKIYLKVDGAEEDTLITNFVLASEELCQDILRFPLSEFTLMPEAVKQAILYAVANLYEDRENVDIKGVIEVMTRLLFAYRKEEW